MHTDLRIDLVYKRYNLLDKFPRTTLMNNINESMNTLSCYASLSAMVLLLFLIRKPNLEYFNGAINRMH